MTMPIDLVLVRHGESEGNVANRASRKGDNRHFSDAFRNRHSSHWRLSKRGIEQAKAAGRWIAENLQPLVPFDRYYCSSYLRAMETAAILEIKGAQWFTDFYLREREWGEMDSMPDDERKQRYAEQMKLRDISPFFWVPVGGESMAGFCLRIDRILDTLHRECSDRRVIIVCHGEVMWAFRLRLERLTEERWTELDQSTDPRNHIHNCQILHYTRRNPDTQALSQRLQWMRSVNPVDLSLSSNNWGEIVLPRWTNADLLRSVERAPLLVEE